MDISNPAGDQVLRRLLRSWFSADVVPWLTWAVLLSLVSLNILVLARFNYLTSLYVIRAVGPLEIALGVITANLGTIAVLILAIAIVNGKVRNRTAFAAALLAPVLATFTAPLSVVFVTPVATWILWQVRRLRIEIQDINVQEDEALRGHPAMRSVAYGMVAAGLLLMYGWALLTPWLPTETVYFQDEYGERRSAGYVVEESSAWVSMIDAYGNVAVIPQSAIERRVPCVIPGRTHRSAIAQVAGVDLLACPATEPYTPLSDPDLLKWAFEEGFTQVR